MVVLVALLLLVFMGMGAIVVDIGALYAERRELQNGADAAALAIAKDCAEDGICPGDTGARHSIARKYADANASDGASNVDRAIIDEPRRQVTVDTSTARAGANIISYSFAQILTGEDGRTVRASAVAEWGAPALATVFPFAISDCNLRHHTAGYTVFPSPTSNTSEFMYRSANRLEAVDPEPLCRSSGRPDANGDGRLNGGWTWLQTRTGVCEARLAVGEKVSESTSRAVRMGDVPGDCIGRLSLLQNKMILVPIFDDADLLGTGSGWLHIVGFAAFQVTGYKFSTTYSYPAIHPCPEGVDDDPPTCIRGRWVKFPGVLPTPVGGPEFGIVAVSLVR